MVEWGKKANILSLRVVGISIVITTLILISRSFSLFPPAVQEDCGECPNPLVEMKNLRMGDISTIADLFKKLAKEFYGWEEGEVSVQEVLRGGLNFLEFKKENPCAEMYYTEMRWTGEKEEEIRHGARQGAAKYNVQSTLNMVKAQPGEKALVRRAVYDEKGREISLQEDYVPKMGTVHIHHELTCLKNNETYDEGDLRIDWLPEPPANELYGYSEKGADGIIVGLFSKGSIAGLPIELSKGDVGRTIRNKETPSSFSLDIEEEPLYPPYYKLEIHTIRNLLGESLPNKIFVALRVKYGEIEGGVKIQGWSVFSTEAGKIETPVLYRVPQCSQTNQDIIEIAAYCDWQAGEAMVGKPQASQKIHIPQCFDLSLTITNTDSKLHEAEMKTDIPSAFIHHHRKERNENLFEASVFVTFKKDPKSIRHVSNDIIHYVYEVESWELGSQNVFIRNQEDEMETSWAGTVHERHYQYSGNGYIQKLDLLGHGELIFIYDRKNEKIIEVKDIPAFDPYIKWSFRRKSRSYTPDTGWSSKDEAEQLEDHHGFIGQSIKIQTIGGDGRTCLTGYARKEKITPPTQEGQTTISGRDVEMMRWELRKR
jgi:hypothetical protein